MKIIFFVSSLGAGGAERVATTLSNGWATRGHEVTLVMTYAGAEDIFYQPSPAVNLISLSRFLDGRFFWGFGYLKKIFFLRKLVSETRPDVVISFLPNVNLMAILSTIYTQIPCIIGERSDPRMQPIGKVLFFACWIFYRFASVVITQTKQVAEAIGFIFPGLKSVKAIPNPLPGDLVNIAPRQEHYLNSGRKILLSIGRLSKEKRVDKIIDAFKVLSVKHPDWDLWIAGDGPQRSSLESLLLKLNILPGRVRFLGNTKQPWMLMKQADAFVLASEYEGFPNTLLEAVALGVPSVSVDCRSGPREISGEESVVRLVKPDDWELFVKALDETMGNESLRLSMGKLGADSVRRRYSLDTILEIWTTILDNLVKSKVSE